MDIRYIARRALFAVTLLTFSPIVISSDVYNVLDFEVNGISLGDDAEQVINTLTELYSISRDDLEIQMSNTFNRKEETPQYVDYDADGISVRTYFGPIGGLGGQLDVEKPYYLEEISFSKVYEPEDYKVFVEKTIEKYGTPSLELYESTLLFWCEKLNADKTDCDEAYASLTLTERSMTLWKQKERK